MADPESATPNAPSKLPQLQSPQGPVDAFERRLVWKLDLMILPILGTIFFLAQMGRSDVGNALIVGMDKDLDVTPARYTTIITLFLVGYILFQPAGTLFLRFLTPPVQLGVAMVSWGIITVCHVKATSWVEMAVMRLFVGIAEAFTQGATLYLSFWYTNNELATRGAIFQSVGVFAGAFNGLLAYAIAKDLGGQGGWAAWRWIFIVEGIIPIVFGFLVIAILPSLPEKTRWGFNAAEKKLLVARTRRGYNSADSRIRMPLFWTTIKDPKLLLLTIAGGGNFYALGALANFLPTIVMGLGYDSIKAQLMTVVVYACSIVSVLFWAVCSDRTKRRGLPVMITSLVMAAGYLIMIVTSPTQLKVRFFGCILMGMGGYPVILLCLLWLVVNTISFTKRAAGLAFFYMVGQLFGIAGNQAYRDPPYYRKGHASSLGAALLTFCCAVACFFYLGWKNGVKKKRLTNLAEAEEVERLRGLDWDEVGDDHPDFMYTV